MNNRTFLNLLNKLNPFNKQIQIWNSACLDFRPFMLEITIIIFTLKEKKMLICIPARIINDIVIQNAGSSTEL